MKDLVRSLRAAGDPIPVPWPSLGRLVRPRRGAVATVLGAPGSGKSTAALEWVDDIRLPCLYISLDTPLIDQAVRFVARRTGRSVEIIETQDPELTRQELESFTSHVRFFGTTIRSHSVGEVVAAETEYWGEAPSVVVIDNMKNLLEKEESPQEYERILGDLHSIARDHHTFILALHHIVRPLRDNKDKAMQRPVMQTDGMYAGERDVSFVFGIWRPRDDQLRVAVLKNRMGRAAIDGSLHVNLEFHGALARVKEMDETRQWVHTQGAKA